MIRWLIFLVFVGWPVACLFRPAEGYLLRLRITRDYHAVRRLPGWDGSRFAPYRAWWLLHYRMMLTEED